jgi:hypothetical protein
MNVKLLRRHIKDYIREAKEDSDKRVRDTEDRRERKVYYQSWTAERILKMTPEQFYEYLGKLWAMLIWGNKQYVVDKVAEENGFDNLKRELAALVWGPDPLETRWDKFRKKIKGIGPAMMSEILCHVHPEQCMLWNRRAYVGLRYLGIENLPRYNYQLTGKRYAELSSDAQNIAEEMRNMGIESVDLLTVDYFIWDELQVEENLSQIHQAPKRQGEESEVEGADRATSEFIHNEIRDKLGDIGAWLGFKSQTEVKVADGSKVDAIWEATIGNMGRVIYVFEVQTKGSIDSLILNLLKALNNPAVQGVVAVTDAVQIEKIKKHAAGVKDFGDKLKYWDYKQVLQVHEALESVNESINSLGLVPQSFY